MRTPSPLIEHHSPSEVGAIALDQAATLLLSQDMNQLARIGIGLDEMAVLQMIRNDLGLGQGMDANPVPGLTPSTIATPAQFLQNWLPGAVHIITTPRLIDRLVGLTVQGSWEDEEIIQTVLEHTAQAVSYGDFVDIPFASWNPEFERRSVVRFLEGMRISRLEEARAARIGVNSAQEKRTAAMLSLEIERNRVGFFGFNGGANRTYGFLNDIDLPNYISLPDGANGDSTFASKTFLEITSDLSLAAQTLRVQSQSNVNPETDRCILAVAQNSYDALISTTTEFGFSVMDWIAKTYKNWEIISVPELDGANGGESVFYLYAMGVANSGTDDGATFVHVCPTKFQSLGNENRIRGYEEGYTNATAG